MAAPVFDQTGKMIFNAGFPAFDSSCCCATGNPHPTLCGDCCSHNSGNMLLTIPSGLTNLSPGCTHCGLSSGPFVLTADPGDSCSWFYCGGNTSGTVGDAGCSDGTLLAHCNEACPNLIFRGGVLVIGGFCYLTCHLKVGNSPFGFGGDVCYILAEAFYQTPLLGVVDFCDKRSYKLNLLPGSTATGCGGAWPIAITLQKV